MKKAIGTAGALAALLIITGCANKEVGLEGESTFESSTPAATISSDTLGSVYFDFDKFNIRSDMQSVVDEASDDLKVRGEYSVVIEGNTDEIGTDEYNYALGTKRAISVRDALVVKGINRDSIRVVSFGESKPICTEQDQECYQKNRRADIKISD